MPREGASWTSLVLSVKHLVFVGRNVRLYDPSELSEPGSQRLPPKVTGLRFHATTVSERPLYLSFSTSTNFVTLRSYPV